MSDLNTKERYAVIALLQDIDNIRDKVEADKNAELKHRMKDSEKQICISEINAFMECLPAII